MQASLFGPTIEWSSALASTAVRRVRGHRGAAPAVAAAVEQALPAIGRARFEAVRLFRARLFNQESQRFYWSECPRPDAFLLLRRLPELVDEGGADHLGGRAVARWKFRRPAADAGVVVRHRVRLLGDEAAVRRRSPASPTGGPVVCVLPFAPRWFSPTAFGAGPPLVDIRPTCSRRSRCWGWRNCCAIDRRTLPRPAPRLRTWRRQRRRRARC